MEGKAGNEHLAAAIAAYQGALDIYTREQLPHDWTMTQNNLAIALWDQADRTEGTKGVELLAQAVTAYRSALSESKFGAKYQIDGPLPCPDGRSPVIRAVWIVDAGTDFPRLITAHPLE